MAWRNPLADQLARRPVCGYYLDQSPASEPTALTALGLLAHDRVDAAQTAADWLLKLQQNDGSIGMRADAAEPRWPTSLAALVWQGLLHHRDSSSCAAGLQHAIDWILSAEGTVMVRPENDAEWPYGHDSELLGWPWVIGTHSWIEPTCLHVLALRAAGHDQHARTREAVRLLFDRQLPEGGCNYGNTSVLGQMLRPHEQPSGMLAAALASEADGKRRLAPTLDYLASRLPSVTAAASLSWSLIGLAANDRSPGSFGDRLQQAFVRENRRASASPYRLALLLLAAAGNASPLFALEGSHQR